MTEDILESFSGNPITYVKEHIMLAALGSVGAAGVLMVLGNAHAWTGVVGAVAAIAVRGVYVYSEQVGQTWTLTGDALVSPTGHRIARGDIAQVRTIFSAAQVITQTGDKYMIKYQADPARTAALIRGEQA